jgi:hypothetical protein
MNRSILLRVAVLTISIGCYVFTSTVFVVSQLNPRCFRIGSGSQLIIDSTARVGYYSRGRGIRVEISPKVLFPMMVLSVSAACCSFFKTRTRPGVGFPVTRHSERTSAGG